MSEIAEAADQALAYEDLRLEIDGRVWTVILNRPEKRNCMRLQTMRELRSVLHQANGDPSCGVVVLRAAGSGAFCSGADVNDFRGADTYEAAYGRYQPFEELAQEFRTLTKPTIGVVEGDAFGGGLALVLMLDLVVASEHARFGVPEIRAGLFPMVVLPGLVRTAGIRRTMEMSFTGRLLSAAEAVENNLVTTVVTPDEIEPTVTKWLGRLSNLDPAVVALGRRSVLTAAEVGFDEAILFGRVAGAAVMSTGAAQATLRGYLS